ncbi:MAG: hypothetical protein ABWY81_11050 [Jiangellaceae bacterium]
MAKTTGLAWPTLSVDDAAGTPVDVRNDVTNFSFATPRGVQDVTGIDKSAYERLLLLADFSITLNGVFNAAVSHLIFRTVSSTAVQRTTSLAIASQTLAPEVLYTDYNLTRAQSGEFTWTVPGVLSNGAVPTWA